MTEAVARSLQAAELMRHSTPEVVNAFLATRCAGGAGSWGSMFGTLGASIDKAQADRIVERAVVAR
jgi:putative acyl-CoA dehydrogenase